MHRDDEAATMVEMELLQADQQSSHGESRALLQLMDNRHLAAFKSLVQRGLKRQPATIDVDRTLAHPVCMSFLDKAAREDLAGFVDFLLEVGANPNRMNVEHDRAPIHFAAEEGNAEALAALLRHPRVNPNLLAAQMTALHFAVKANCEICLRLLLDAAASPNIPNSKGLTALHLAAEKNSRSMVQIIIDHTKIQLDLDTYRDRRKETARSLIEKKFPDIQLPAESDKPDDATLLRYYLLANDEDNFAKTLSRVKELAGPEILAELLRLSVERNLARATDELLTREGADSVSLLELAKVAIERAHPRILRKLLDMRPKMADRLLLAASQELGIPASSSTGTSQDRMRCLKLVLDKPEVDVRQEDDKGNSPLHYAARAECREAIELLLKKGSYLGHTNGFGTPPLAHIAAGILEEHLNSCLSSTNERSEEYEIVMDYRNLVPHSTDCGAGDDYLERAQRRRSSRASIANEPCSETEALLYIANSKSLRHLLKHPILASFLYLKYLRIRHVLYVNTLLYLLFYSLLIVYIWMITSDAPELQDSSGNASALQQRRTSNGDEVDEGMASNWKKHPVLSLLVAISLMYLLARESLQLASSPLNYVASPENWLETALIGLTVALLLGAGREVGALAILISTWELVILIGQHPRLSTDIEMFKTVTVNFSKFLFLYIFLIVAFAFAFFVLFKGDDNFTNPLGSLFKTIVMLTGEFDSSDLPFVAYPLLSRLIFIGFIFLIVIILLNLLNGLAVNDTAEILAEAELVCLVSRARLVAYAERMVVGAGPLSPSALSSDCCCCCCCCFARAIGSGSTTRRFAGRMTRAPARFVARRILLFPRYLPHARLSVRPLKSYEITLHGRAMGNRAVVNGRCSNLTMDPTIAQRAKQVLADRDKQSAEERIVERLRAFEARFDRLDLAVKRILLMPMQQTAHADPSSSPTETDTQEQLFTTDTNYFD